MIVAGRLFTIGHGADDRDTLRDRLQQAGVLALVDVRRFPGSRHNPDVHFDALAKWVPDSGIGYRWEECFGGRRTLSPGEPVVDTWWRMKSFQAYAAHTRTEDFANAMARMTAKAHHTQVAVMCSESVWWRCHRRLIADVATVIHGIEVQHLMPDGRTVEHRTSQGVRRLDDGHLVWDGSPEAEQSNQPPTAGTAPSVYAGQAQRSSLLSFRMKRPASVVISSRNAFETAAPGGRTHLLGDSRKPSTRQAIMPTSNAARRRPATSRVEQLLVTIRSIDTASDDRLIR